ncbi:MAG: hypothetical protein GQ544_05820 [Candidatus Aminicenantes bacterium]|nr:hypothetical protein [Candidatus Aminicenantes bacterium]
MLSIIISFEIIPAKQKEFEQAVPWLITPNKEDNKDVRQQILHDIGKPTQFVYLRDCESREDLESHLRSERFRALLGGMKLLGKIVSAEIHKSDQVEQLSLIG